MTVELLDLETQFALRKAAPIRPTVSRNMTEFVVKLLVEWAADHAPDHDVENKPYWEATYKELSEGSGIELSTSALGRILRTLALTSWRKKEGFSVSWSSAQLQILIHAFEIEVVLDEKLVNILNMGAIKE